MAIQRIEVITGAGGRRSYTAEEKIRLVGEARGGHGAVAAVARRHGVCRSLIYRWRRQIRSGELTAAVPSFVPVQVVEAPPAAAAVASPAPEPPGPAGCRAATVEVVLANGRVLRVAEDIAPAALRRLVGALDGP